MKLKECSSCHAITTLWQSSPKLCKNCAMKYKSDQPKTYVKVASSKSIKPISDKQAERLKAYRVVRDAYMSDHPFCEHCGSMATDIHHRKGRGEYLCNPEFFMAACRRCHTKIETEVKWAIEQGYSLSRLEQ